MDVRVYSSGALVQANCEVRDQCAQAVQIWLIIRLNENIIKIFTPRKN